MAVEEETASNPLDDPRIARRATWQELSEAEIRAIKAIFRTAPGLTKSEKVELYSIAHDMVKMQMKYETRNSSFKTAYIWAAFTNALRMLLLGMADEMTTTAFADLVFHETQRVEIANGL